MISHPRTLALVDLENLVGCSPSQATENMYRQAFTGFVSKVGISVGDLIVIGVHPRLAYCARDVCPSARIVTRSGPDGAELRLISVVDDMAFVAERFDEVVIASGDWRFHDLVVELNRSGVPTTVAALPGHLAGYLRAATRRIVWLRLPESTGVRPAA